jgi:hypothetical protein
MVAVTAVIGTAVMVGMAIMVTCMAVTDTVGILLTTMVTAIGTDATGMVVTGADTVAIGGMVAGGRMARVPAGNWCPAAGSGFATDSNAALDAGMFPYFLIAVYGIGRL